MNLRSLDNSFYFLAECPVLYVDMMFVIDGSASIGKKNFAKVRDWVVNISAKFDIDEGNVKVGVMQFSHWFEGRLVYFDRNNFSFRMADFISAYLYFQWENYRHHTRETGARHTDISPF